MDEGEREAEKRFIEKHKSENKIDSINENYIPDGHDGANHVNIQLNGGYKITRKISTLGRLTYNITVDPDLRIFAEDRL